MKIVPNTNQTKLIDYSYSNPKVWILTALTIIGLSLINIEVRTIALGMLTTIPEL